MGILYSKIRREVWRRGEDEYTPNVFVGNVGHILTSAEDVINAFSVPELAVYNFQIDANNNVSFFVGRPFRWERGMDDSGWLYQNPDITYFYDLDGNLTRMSVQTLGEDTTTGKLLKAFISTSEFIDLIGTSTRMFMLNNLLTDFYAPGIRRLSRRDFRYTYPTHLYFPNVTELEQAFYEISSKVVIYIGNYTGGGMDSTNMFGQIVSGSEIYFHPMFLTSNGGGLSEALIYAQNQGAILKPVHDKTVPDSITDLLHSNVTANSVQLSFTAPASVNAIDYYEVWLKEVGVFDPVRDVLPTTKRVTATGQTVTGLKPNTMYQLKLATVDEYYNGTGQDVDINRRAFSNTITFQTLPI